MYTNITLLYSISFNVINRELKSQINLYKNVEK